MLDTEKICHVCQRSRHLSLRATVGPDGDTLIEVEPCRHNRGYTELEFSETTIAEAGRTLICLSVRLPELGLVGYQDTISGERDAEWHREKFKRQLSDPEHIERLKRERKAAKRRHRATLDAWPDI